MMDQAALTDNIEYWQRGPVPGIPDLLQPVAHTLLQVRLEVLTLAKVIDQERLWNKPAGLASPGFHLIHMTGVLDRLFTYARGKELSPQQLQNLSQENGSPDICLDMLIRQFSHQVDLALGQLAETDPAMLTQTCYVGRKKIPSTRIGLLFHAAEHLMRHTGQLLVTVRGRAE